MNEQLAVAPRKTRAQVLRDKVVIRLALDETGPLIADLLKANGVEIPGADWSKVFPHWLIATVDDEVIGCLQVMPSKPIAYCEMLHTKPTAPFKLRALAIRKLIQQGIATAHYAGASMVGCNVDDGNRKLASVIEHLGVIRLTGRVLYIKGCGSKETDK